MVGDCCGITQQWIAWGRVLPPGLDPQASAFTAKGFAAKSAMRLPAPPRSYALSNLLGPISTMDAQGSPSPHDRQELHVQRRMGNRVALKHGQHRQLRRAEHNIFPRPFMVEPRPSRRRRARSLGRLSEYGSALVSTTSWPRRPRNAIEFFQGGHTINGQGTLIFCTTHLRLAGGGWRKKRCREGEVGKCGMRNAPGVAVRPGCF